METIARFRHLMVDLEANLREPLSEALSKMDLVEYRLGQIAVDRIIRNSNL